MGIFSIFQGGAKYFDKKITPKCDYCQYGKRSNAGNKIICEKKGLVDPNYSCSNFGYSPLKRIPVKQLNFVGSLADEDIYIESKGDIAEKEAAEKAEAEKNKPAPKPAAPAPQPAPAPQEAPAAQEAQPQPQQTPAPQEAPEAKPVQDAQPAQTQSAPQAAPQNAQPSPAPQAAPAQQNAPEQQAPQAPNAQ